MPDVQRVGSGAPWEKKFAYCRALRVGDRILVSGTAPVAEDGGLFAPGDAYAQANRCIDIIERALRDLGADLTAVIRTRMYVTDIGRAEEVGRAHGERFADHPPVTTMVEVAGLVDPEMLVEIEAEALARP